MFGELMSAVERSQAELLEVVEMGRRAAELRSQAFIRDLETEIVDLRKRSSNLNQLVQSQDHFTFFKVYINCFFSRDHFLSKVFLIE